MDNSAAERHHQIHHAGQTAFSQDQGSFRTNFNFPGHAVDGHADHGYGPLATVVESFMDPGTLIGMHQHTNEEIISWVPAGVMRHDDHEGNELVTDGDHLMVMNSGRGFWHAEATARDDPPLRMLQIFVRPHSLSLEPHIQHERIADPVANEWRHLSGPEGSEAPLFVRNAVDCFDCRVGVGSTVSLPGRADWDTYLYVFEGAVTLDAGGRDDGVDLEETESAVITAPAVDDTDKKADSELDSETGESGIDTDDDVLVTAVEQATLIAFSLDPHAPITRQGTIGR